MSCRTRSGKLPCMALKTEKSIGFPVSRVARGKIIQMKAPTMMTATQAAERTVISHDDGLCNPTSLHRKPRAHNVYQAKSRMIAVLPKGRPKGVNLPKQSVEKNASSRMII